MRINTILLQFTIPILIYDIVYTIIVKLKHMFSNDNNSLYLHISGGRVVNSFLLRLRSVRFLKLAEKIKQKKYQIKFHHVLLISNYKIKRHSAQTVKCSTHNTLMLSHPVFSNCGNNS